MPERITTTTTLAGCLLHGAAYGTCLHLLGMPVDALLLGAISAGIAHGLNETTSRKAGWMRIGIGTLLAGAGAPLVAAAAFLAVDVGTAESTLRPVTQSLAAVVIGAAWPKLSGVLFHGLQSLVSAWTKRLGGGGS